MRTILRNRTTEFYFQGVADWTEELGEAFDFKSPERAVKFVLGAGLKVNEMEIVFAFDDARYNIALPIDERFGMQPATSEQRSEMSQPTLPELASVTVLNNQLTQTSTSNLGL